MAYLPPPPQLSSKEFDRRIVAGAKTLAEIDPEFWKWKEGMDFQHKVQGIILSFGAVVLAIALLIILFK